MTAKLYALEQPKGESIPEALRRIADEVERGEIGEAGEGVLVLCGEYPKIFALSASATCAYYMLGCAKHRMEMGAQ